MGNNESQEKAARSVTNAPTPSPMLGQRVTEFKRYPQEVKDYALALIDQGVPYRQIAAQIGPHCSTATIARWRKEKDDEEKNAEKMKKFEIYRKELDREEERIRTAQRLRELQERMNNAL